MKYDFIFVRNGDEGDLIASNGQVISLHNNQEHMLGTTFGKITIKNILQHGIDEAFQKLWNGDETRYLLDFEDDQEMTMEMLQECGEYIMPGKNALTNLLYIDTDEKEELIQEILISFLRGEDIKEVKKNINLVAR